MWRCALTMPNLGRETEAEAPGVQGEPGTQSEIPSQNKNK